MVPFDVVPGRYGVIGNSGGVTNLSESFEVLSPSVMSSSVSFTDVEHITIPVTAFVNNLRFLREAETISVRKEGLNSASVPKSNPEVDKTIKRIYTYCCRSMVEPSQWAPCL